MKHHSYPTDLSDRQWDCIKDLIPAAKPGGRPRSLDMRQVINAMLSIVVSGIPWRMLPKDYPKWKTVYHYLRTWSDDGIWQRIHDTLRAAVRRKAVRRTSGRRPGWRGVQPRAIGQPATIRRTRDSDDRSGRGDYCARLSAQAAQPVPQA